MSLDPTSHLVVSRPKGDETCVDQAEMRGAAHGNLAALKACVEVGTPGGQLPYTFLFGDACGA